MKKISLFGSGAGDDSEEIAEPGTPDNPWIGPVDRKTGKVIPASGKQLRDARRQTERHQAAAKRVASRAYVRNEKPRRRYEAFRDQRLRILSGQVKVTLPMARNIAADNARRAAVTRGFEALANRQQAKSDRRDDRLDERRIARFKAGKPRGKDLREDVMNQYSHYLPAWYWHEAHSSRGY